jgi:ABC-2 type transport system permease protein
MRILAIFMNDWRRLSKDIGLMVALVLMPLAMILPSVLTYPVDEEEGLKGTPLVVADYDGAEISADYIAELSANLLIEQGFSGDDLSQYNLQEDPRCLQPGPECDEAVGRARLADGSRDALLVIPQGLSAAFNNSQQTKVELLYDPGGDALLITQIEKVSQGLAIKVALSKQIEGAKDDFIAMSSLSDPEVQSEIETIINQPSGDQASQTAIHVDEVYPATYEEKDLMLMAEIIPQFSVLFVFLFVMFATNWSREEQSNGLFRRLLSTPTGKAELIGGKVLFGLTVCILQMLILFGVGIVAGNMRGLPFTFDIPGFILVTVALAAAVTTMGVLFASTSLPASLAIAPMLLGGLLGGCMIALDFMPPLMVPFSYLMPQRYGIIGYQDLMSRGGNLAAVLPEAGILFLFSLVFLAIAVWRFDLAD